MESGNTNPATGDGGVRRQCSSDGNTYSRPKKKKQVERAPRRGEQLRCPICERKFERRARQQQYCSARCCERGRRRSRKALLGQGTGAPADPTKIASKNNALRGAKNGSSIFANAPLNILGGGSWRWTDTAHIDGKTWGKVVRAEVGGAP